MNMLIIIMLYIIQYKILVLNNIIINNNFGKVDNNSKDIKFKPKYISGSHI